MRRFYQSAIFYVLILLIIIGVLQYIMSGTQQKTVLTWSQFVTDMNNHEIKSLYATSNGATIQLDGTLMNNTQFTSRALYSDQIAAQISKQPNVMDYILTARNKVTAAAAQSGHPENLVSRRQNGISRTRVLWHLRIDKDIGYEPGPLHSQGLYTIPLKPRPKHKTLGFSARKPGFPLGR